MNVVITSATTFEVAQLKNNIDPLLLSGYKGLSISFHVSGVGILQSTFSISKLVLQSPPDFIIQAGIAGTFDHDAILGKVVAVNSEVFCNTGAWEEGRFRDLFDLNLADRNEYPFKDGSLVNHWLKNNNFLLLESQDAVTVDEVSTNARTIDFYRRKTKNGIESMEGAPLHYCCLQSCIPFIQIRAISNYVGDRNKNNWKFDLAFTNLAETLKQYIHHLQATNNLDT